MHLPSRRTPKDFRILVWSSTSTNRRKESTTPYSPCCESYCLHKLPKPYPVPTKRQVSLVNIGPKPYSPVVHALLITVPNLKTSLNWSASFLLAQTTSLAFSSDIYYINAYAYGGVEPALRLPRFALKQKLPSYFSAFHPCCPGLTSAFVYNAPLARSLKTPYRAGFQHLAFNLAML